MQCFPDFQFCGLPIRVRKDRLRPFPPHVSGPDQRKSALISVLCIRARSLNETSKSSNLDEPRRLMRTFSANEAKQSLGRLLDSAQQEPVLIQRHQRDVAVVISPHEYDRLRGLNVREFQDFCAQVGQQARARGLTDEKLAELLADDGA